MLWGEYRCGMFRLLVTWQRQPHHGREAITSLTIAGAPTDHKHSTCASQALLAAQGNRQHTFFFPLLLFDAANALASFEAWALGACRHRSQSSDISAIPGS